MIRRFTHHGTEWVLYIGGRSETMTPGPVAVCFVSQRRTVLGRVPADPRQLTDDELCAALERALFEESANAVLEWADGRTTLVADPSLTVVNAELLGADGVYHDFERTARKDEHGRVIYRERVR